jgi:ABC-type phosphate transport system substrate-binding protein
MANRLTASILCLAFFALLFGSVPRSTAQDVSELVVIVHPSRAAAVGSLSAADLQAIFTRKKQFWGDGNKITPLNLAKGSVARNTFDLVVLGFDPDASARYWVDQGVRGGARAPSEVPSPELAIKTLAVMRDAISYVPASLAGPSVAIVARVRGGKVSAGR